jgi:uncharacterized protein (TIGR02452 family)
MGQIAMNHKSKQLAEIYSDTVAYCASHALLVHPPIKYNYLLPEMDDNEVMLVAIPFNKRPMIIVENVDSFEMATKMKNGKGPVLVLNLASYTTSGGGVVTGALAQEEELYRRSNYHLANDEKFYPIKMSEAIYSPIVHIIKDQQYQLLPIPYVVSCLAVPAIKNPPLQKSRTGKDIFRNHRHYQATKEKINMIFKIAIKHGHTDLVLGALGCGAYRNPPELIAEIFNLAIKKYGHYFERIGFAILSNPGNPNFDIFQKLIN